MIKFLKNLTVNFLFTLLPLFIFTGSADLISEFSVFSLTTRMILGGVLINTFLIKIKDSIKGYKDAFSKYYGSTY